MWPTCPKTGILQNACYFWTSSIVYNTSNEVKIAVWGSLGLGISPLKFGGSNSKLGEGPFAGRALVGG